MNHLSELEAMMWVDGESQDTDLTRQHLAECEECTRLVAQLKGEQTHLRASLALEVAEVPAPDPAGFKRPTGLRQFAIANLATAVVLWLGQFLWKFVLEELVFTTLSWLALPMPDVIGITMDFIFRLYQGGATMMDTYIGLVVMTLIATVLGLLIFSRFKRGNMVMANLLVAAMATLLVPAPALAVDIRHDETSVTIKANEVVDDSLFLGAEVVTIDGTVNGNLVAFSDTVKISGTIKGNLITAAENVTVTGTVGGSMILMASDIDVSANIAGDAVTAADRVSFSSEARVNGNTAVAAKSITFAGQTERDFYTAAERITMNGTVGRHLEAWGDKLALGEEARIGGNVRFRAEDDDELTQSPLSRVDGEVEVIGVTYERTNRYLTGEFYVGQMLLLIASLLFGLVLFWLLPNLRDVEVGDGLDGAKSAGIGLITIVSLPIIAIMVAFTVVGLPFTIIGLVGWIVLMYIAKIVVAGYIGSLLLADSERANNAFMVLLVGLVPIYIAINLPFIGGILGFLLTIVGAGLVIQQLFEYIEDNRALGH